MDRGAVANLRHVLHVNRRAVHDFDRHVVQLPDRARTAVEFDLIIAIPKFGVTGRKNQVLQRHGVRYVARRNLLGVHRVGVQIREDGPELPSVRVRNGGALDGGKLGSDKGVTVIEQSRFAHGLAAQTDLQNRYARNVVLQNVRRERSRRIPSQIRLRIRNYLSLREFDAGPWMEVDPDHRHAVVGLALDMFDIVDARGKAAFKPAHDSVRHLFGGKSVVLINDAENGDIDIRKDIDRHHHDGNAPQNHDQQRHDHERIGTPQR